MGGCQHLRGVMVLTLAFRGIAAVAGNSVEGLSIQVRHKKSGVFLHCSVGSSDSVESWSKDGRKVDAANKTELWVGMATDDPRGLYRCDSTQGRQGTLQLYFRMCQYCIQLNSATVLGMVAANIFVTAFLAGAVWCLAAQQPSGLSQASDKQALLAHEQLYQPLGERNNGQYSHIGVAKARRR